MGPLAPGGWVSRGRSLCGAQCHPWLQVVLARVPGSTQSQGWARSSIQQCLRAPSQFRTSVRLREAPRWRFRAENPFPWKNGNIRKRIARPPAESRTGGGRREEGLGFGWAGPGEGGGRGPSWNDHAGISGCPVRGCLSVCEISLQGQNHRPSRRQEAEPLIPASCPQDSLLCGLGGWGWKDQSLLEVAMSRSRSEVGDPYL